MVVLHHLENSRSQRFLWLLEELGTDYELKTYRRDAETSLAPPELLAVHPMGKAPVITHDGRTIAESGAIIEYLLDQFDAEEILQPAKSTAAYQQYRYWMHFAEGSFMPLMVMSLIFNRLEKARMPFFAKPIAKSIAGKVRQSYLQPNTKRALDFMESTLAASKWFAGPDFSAADIQMSFPVEAAATRTGLDDRYPALQAFLDRIHARPAYGRALERGGELTLMS